MTLQKSFRLAGALHAGLAVAPGRRARSALDADMIRRLSCLRGACAAPAEVDPRWPQPEATSGTRVTHEHSVHAVLAR